MNSQEYKVVNLSNGFERFFFKHSSKSALFHAEAYLKRNADLFPMQLYAASNKPKPFPKWLLIK